MSSYLENFEHSVVSENDSFLSLSFSFKEDHSFVDGHFDDFKILPGAAQIGIAKSCIERFLKKEISISKLVKTKFMGVVIPNQQFIVKVVQVNNQTFEWTLTQSEQIKAKGIFTYE